MSRRSILEQTTHIDAPLTDVFAFFSSPVNLARITPPDMGFRVTEGPDRALRQDDRIHYAIRVLGVPLRWTTRITLWRDGEAFTDFQERGPYRYWLHTHTFREAAGGVEMHDRVEYELPFGLLGRIFGTPIVRRQLEAIFAFRATAIREIFSAR